MWEDITTIKCYTSLSELPYDFYILFLQSFHVLRTFIGRMSQKPFVFNNDSTLQ